MWTEIRLPAIAENDDPIGRKPGEALCPERFNIKELLKIRDQIGPQLFDAMYQQNPSTPGNQIFKIDWWQFYRKEKTDPEGSASYFCMFFDTIQRYIVHNILSSSCISSLGEMCVSTARAAMNQ